MKYKIIRTKRKTIQIKVKEDVVEIRAPYNCPNSYIEKLLEKRKDWIEKNIEELAQRKNNIEDEKNIKLFGKSHMIIFENSDVRRNCLNFNGENFIFSIYNLEMLPIEEKDEIIKSITRRWFLQAGQKHLEKRTKELASELGFTIGKVKVKDVKSIWGSCSAANNINLNYRLMMVEPKACDYVLIHELCHTEVKNHSKTFWNLVRSIMPDYEEYRRLLKEI